MALSLVVSGATGRMGNTVARLAKADPEVQLIGGIDRQTVESPPDPYPSLVAAADSRDLIAGADVLIDFSAPAFIAELLAVDAVQQGDTALVVGTTGLDSELQGALDQLADRVPVLQAANFSIGVNLLIALTERAASVLGPEFDVEVVETHHRRKEDAPSGTALALGEAVALGRQVELGAVRRDGRTGRPGPRPTGEIGFHSLRGGDVVGEHQVQFIGELETIELAHHASDRALFAAGALRAARWLAGRAPGRYTMRDVLGF